MQDQHFPLVGSRAPVRAADRRTSEDDSVVDFASWVVSLLAARKVVAEVSPRPEIVEGLIAAAASPDVARLDLFLRELVRQKIGAAAVADIYIPAAARQLGQDWHDDRTTFAEVTLATARLQSMLRAIGSTWVADLAQPDQVGAVLLVVPPREQHTLGAMVVLGQLRRLGISVRLLVAPSPSELKKAMETARFDGVLISSASAVRLAELRVFVETIRRSGPRGMPIVLGGGLLHLVEDVKAKTGVDAVAPDLPTALEACSLVCDANGTRKRA